MKRHCRLPIVASLMLFAAVSFTGGLAHAAPQSITMTPTSVSPVIKPGSVYKGSLQVLNQGGTAYTFQVYSAPYHVKGEDYTPDFTALPTAPNVKSWFKFSTTGGHVNPGQSITVNYAISMPANTPPGGYYAVVFAQTKYPKTASITLNERVGEIFYIQAAGPVTKQGELVSWQSAIFQKPPLTAVMRLENSGGIHYPAAIQVDVRDVFGRSKYSLSTTKEVLPQTIRRVTVSWSKAPSLGIFKVTGTVSFLNQHKTLPTKWVFVMSQTVRLVLLGLLVLIILLSAARHAYRRRSAGKTKK